MYDDSFMLGFTGDAHMQHDDGSSYSLDHGAHDLGNTDLSSAGSAHGDPSGAAQALTPAYSAGSFSYAHEFDPSLTDEEFTLDQQIDHYYSGDTWDPSNSDDHNSLLEDTHAAQALHQRSGFTGNNDFSHHDSRQPDNQLEQPATQIGNHILQNLYLIEPSGAVVDLGAPTQSTSGERLDTVVRMQGDDLFSYTDTTGTSYVDSVTVITPAGATTHYSIINGTWIRNS